MVHVSGLHKAYGSGRRRVEAVQGVDFHAERGEILGLLGPNGAGKTSTIKCLATLLIPDSGTIRIGGVDALRHPRQARTRIAAVLEGSRNVYWRMTPRENLRFFAGLQGIPLKRARKDVEELLERFGLQDKAATPVMNLSLGMKQKLAVGCALVKRTPVLLLDEPTLGLDVATSLELRRILREMAETEGRTILLSSHDMRVVESVCQRVVIINQGRVVAQDRIESLKRIFGARAFRFVLEAAPSPEQERRLREEFPLVRIEPADEGAELQVDFLDGDGFYRAVEILRAGGSQVLFADQVLPDLEQIFLAIVEGDRP